ncbi:MAG: elongation factor G [Alphaproteobacteria bacterium]
MTDKKGSRSGGAPRCVAFVGPQSSGKTTLMESILFATGAIGRKGTVKDGSTVGDSSDEARARQMSTEVSIAATTYLDDSWTILDCPGSVELAQEAQSALMAADAAVVVCEPDAERAMALAPLLRFLDAMAIPHMLFINKMDNASVRVSDLMQALQGVSGRPLVLRQVPIREGEHITGYVDLVSERAYHYKPGQASDLIQLPDSVAEHEQAARQDMLEALSDFDDTLLEQLLEDIQPPKDEIYQQIVKDLAGDLIVPVLLGAADRDHGVRRLLKALRHDVPGPETTAERLDIPAGDVVAQVFKTVHAAHAGKLSLARVWRGTVEDGMNFSDSRLSGLYQIVGGNQTKLAKAGLGSVVAMGRLELVSTGEILRPDNVERAAMWPDPLTPVYSLAIHADNRADEVKLSSALQKLIDEDPSMSYEQVADTNELVIRGQGEIHLLIAIDRLHRRYNVAVSGQKPRVPYQETIRKGISQHARFKRQSGGHGQFADVHVDIKARPRGAGFEFIDKIVGGVVPRQYIPSVEHGALDYMAQGPLGFPVVDIAVTLNGGQFHSVDSSDMAFRTAGRMALAEGLPKCDPVLLEPIWQVNIVTPSEFTPKAQRILSSRRGQILGYDARPGWDGWDEVKAYLPQAELHDLIIELRSLTLGVGTYTAEFDHLAELTGRLAVRVIETRQASIAAQ